MIANGSKRLASARGGVRLALLLLALLAQLAVAGHLVKLALSDDLGPLFHWVLAGAAAALVPAAAIGIADSVYRWRWPRGGATVTELSDAEYRFSPSIHIDDTGPEHFVSYRVAYEYAAADGKREGEWHFEHEGHTKGKVWEQANRARDGRQPGAVIPIWRNPDDDSESLGELPGVGFPTFWLGLATGEATGSATGDALAGMLVFVGAWGLYYVLISLRRPGQETGPVGTVDGGR